MSWLAIEPVGSVERSVAEDRATVSQLQALAELLVASSQSAGAAIFLLRASSPPRRDANAARLCLAASAGSISQPSSVVEDLARATVLAASEDRDRRLPTPPRDLLVVPVERDRVALGVVVVEATGSVHTPWAEHVRQVASIVAAIEDGHRAAVESQRREVELEALDEIGGAVERATTTEEVLEAIFDASLRVLRCDTASLFVVDERGESLQMIAGRNVPTEVIQTSSFRMGEGVAGWVAAQNRPVIVDDVTRDSRYRFPASGLDEPRSLLVVPLRRRSKVIATLSLARRGTDAFRPPDLAFAEKLAVYAAQALEHARLLKLQAKAESLRVRFETLSGISHDIRTSLTHVKLAAKLAEHSDGEEKRVELLRMIVQKIDEISKLVNTGLEASRLEVELSRLKLTTVSLEALLRDVLEEIGPKLSSAHELAVSVPADLAVQADAIQLRRVLVNLLDNAVKYSPSGGAIRVAAVPRGDVVRISVRDEGIGIGAEHLDRIFEQFYRAPEASAFAGCGMGLYACRRIVEAHGGALRAESASGKGCTFTVTMRRGPSVVPRQERWGRARARRSGTAARAEAASHPRY